MPSCKSILMAERWNNADWLSGWRQNYCYLQRASLVVQRVKNLPAIQDIWLQSLGHEHPLEKEMATHSSILAWRIPWTEEPGRLQSIESQRVRMTKQLTHIQQGYHTVRKWWMLRQPNVVPLVRFYQRDQKVLDWPKISFGFSLHFTEKPNPTYWPIQ